jgi:ribonuclease D
MYFVMSDEADSFSPLRNYRMARSEHRARSHDAGHESTPADAPPPPQHPLIPRGQAPLLATAEDLEELLAHLRSAGSFAYDSEFIGELTYIPKLCVIQVATTQRVALIDPLAGLDLSEFWKLICDERVEKIVHAGQQDLEPVFRHLEGQRPANVFDTQIAAGFAAMSYPAALGKLVRELIGAWIGKGLTFSHWDKRPLSAMQLRYAADDVRYLPALRAQIGQRLEQRGHTAWVQEECAALCDPALYYFDAETQCRRVRGSQALSGIGLGILHELVVWRNAAAMKHDMPPRSFLRDEILVDLARNPVTSVEKLSRVRGLPRPVEETYGSQIVQAIARAAAPPPQEAAVLQHAPVEETPSDKFRADSLWALLQTLSLGCGIDPNLVASRQEIVHLYRCRNDEVEPDDLRVLFGWRRQAVGELLLQIARGQKTAQIAWETDGLKIRENT